MPNYIRCSTCCVLYKAVFEPRNNCSDCWAFYFKRHPGIVTASSSVLRAFDKQTLVKAKGKVWTKQFIKFYESEKLRAELMEVSVG